jgi:small subunit ribosomal protein S28e
MQDNPVTAQVLELLGKTGSRGGITQVRVQLIDPNNGQQRQLIRNVLGPVRKGDTLSLMECEREARRLR